MNLTRNIHKYILISMLLLISGSLFQSCSTKKNTWRHRTFHNVTARYNGYYYACEAIKEGVAKLEKAHQDDYTRILPVYKLGAEGDAKNIYPEMNRAFEKSSNVISKHSILIKDKEYVNWIDDNYLAVGISHYYKRDYFAAAEVFDYIIKQYKKEEIRYDAIVWLIRTYNENAIVSQAQMLIDVVDNDKKFPKRIRGDLDMAIADFYLKREDYPMTAKYLEKALPNIKKKKVKTRINYILAQLYQKTGDDRKALAKYGQVLKLSPDYEMAFQAKINQARSYTGDSKGKKGIKAQLVKMSKEKKNEEYYDQIFYALAEISLREKDEPKAVAYLNKSISSSVENRKQKALSYLLLGDIYFKKPDYKNAQAYYDSCATILPKDYVDYPVIMERKEILTDLIVNLSTIAREDSLQRIARMDSVSRDQYLDQMIEKLVKAEEKRIQEEAERQELLARQGSGGTPIGPGGNEGGNSGGVGADWYFYNRSLIASGFNDFRKKWGERKNEDNWRRSTKESAMYEDTEAGDGDEELNPATKEGQDAVLEAIRDKKQYLKDLPLTEEKMKASTELIVDAYYSAGSIYKEQLLDNQNAIKTFEELMSRYPGNKYDAKTYYQLYRSNLAIQNEPRAEYYKSLLFTQFPNSEYVRIIKNPASGKKTTASKDEIETFYEETYQKYLQGQYGGVMINCIRAEEEYPNTAYSPKFEMLKAMVIGRTQGVVAFEDALRQIVALYPNDPVKVKAEEILEFIVAQKPEPAGTDTIPSKYKLYKESAHNMVLIVDNNVDMTELKIAISDFNSSFFGNEKFNISNLPLTSEKQMVVITGLKDQAKSINYYKAITGDLNVMARAGKDPQAFTISVENYPVFYKDKVIEDYQNFFNARYLKK